MFSASAKPIEIAAGNAVGIREVGKALRLRPRQTARRDRRDTARRIVFVDREYSNDRSDNGHRFHN
jgi:hypothetical protein